MVVWGRTHSSLPPPLFYFLSLAYSHFQGNQIVFVSNWEKKKKTKPEFQSDKDLRKLTEDIVLHVSHTNALQDHVSLVFSV